MPRPTRPRRARTAAPTAKKLNAFLHHLGRTGSVTFAATRARLQRRTLYKLRATDESFALRWDEALDLGVERLQDDAMRRALDGVARPVWRGGKEVGSVRQFDNKLLQFLLRAHRPETYGDGRRTGGLPPLPFDLAERLAASQPRLDAHRAEMRAEEEARRRAEKPDAPKPH